MKKILIVGIFIIFGSEVSAQAWYAETLKPSEYLTQVQSGEILAQKEDIIEYLEGYLVKLTDKLEMLITQSEIEDDVYVPTSEEHKKLVKAWHESVEVFFLSDTQEIIDYYSELNETLFDRGFITQEEYEHIKEESESVSDEEMEFGLMFIKAFIVFNEDLDDETFAQVGEEVKYTREGNVVTVTVVTYEGEGGTSTQTSEFFVDSETGDVFPKI